MSITDELNPNLLRTECLPYQLRLVTRIRS